MFEERPQPEIDALMKSNPEFKQLYQRHKDLDKKVMDAELGVLPIDDITLAQMKREKLAAKDRLASTQLLRHPTIDWRRFLAVTRFLAAGRRLPRRSHPSASPVSRARRCCADRTDARCPGARRARALASLRRLPA